MSDPIKGRSDAAWRQKMGDMQQLLGQLAEELDPAFSVAGVQARAIVRRAAHLLNSAEANVRAEERHAWDRYAAATIPAGLLPDNAEYRAAEAVKYADAMLEERRKRFARKEES